MSRNISQKGIDFIVGFEGKHKLLSDGRYAAYLDTLAKPPCPTIYCGLTKGIKMGMVITKEQGDALFSRELAIYDNAVDELVKVPLSQGAHDACVSFVYNCGIGAFKGSTLLKLINQGKMEQAAAQFHRWNKAGGKVWPGLVRRRAAEAAMFLDPDPIGEPKKIAVPDTDGSVKMLPETAMPQRVEVSTAPVKEVLTSSWSIRGALAAISGAAMQVYNWTLPAATEAGMEAGKLKTSLSGWDALFGFLGANMGLLAAMFVVLGAGIVIARRIQQHQEGRA